MPRWFKIVLATVCGLAALTLAAFCYIIWSFGGTSWDLSGIDDAHRRARNDFNASLGTPICLTRDAIIAEATRRNWPVRDQDDFLWCHSPTGLTNWLNVQIEPPLFMSTEDENAAFFGFDGAGCSVQWSYANGAGTTCPDL